MSGARGDFDAVVFIKCQTNHTITKTDSKSLPNEYALAPKRKMMKHGRALHGVAR